MLFQPSYVPQEKTTDSGSSSGSVHGGQSKLNRKKRLSVQDGVMVKVKVPSMPTLDYFRQMNADPATKNLLCDHTFRIVAQKNNDIYGEETRANDDFLKEAMSAKYVPVSGHFSPSFIA